MKTADTEIKCSSTDFVDVLQILREDHMSLTCHFHDFSCILVAKS